MQGGNFEGALEYLAFAGDLLHHESNGAFENAGADHDDDDDDHEHGGRRGNLGGAGAAAAAVQGGHGAGSSASSRRAQYQQAHYHARLESNGGESDEELDEAGAPRSARLEFIAAAIGPLAHPADALALRLYILWAKCFLQLDLFARAATALGTACDIYDDWCARHPHFCEGVHAPDHLRPGAGAIAAFAATGTSLRTWTRAPESLMAAAVASAAAPSSTSFALTEPAAGRGASGGGTRGGRSQQSGHSSSSSSSSSSGGGGGGGGGPCSGFNPLRWLIARCVTGGGSRAAFEPAPLHNNGGDDSDEDVSRTGGAAGLRGSRKRGTSRGSRQGDYLELTAGHPGISSGGGGGSGGGDGPQGVAVVGAAASSKGINQQLNQQASLSLPAGAQRSSAVVRRHICLISDMHAMGAEAKSLRQEVTDLLAAQERLKRRCR